MGKKTDATLREPVKATPKPKTKQKKEKKQKQCRKEPVNSLLSLLESNMSLSPKNTQPKTKRQSVAANGLEKLCQPKRDTNFTFGQSNHSRTATEQSGDSNNLINQHENDAPLNLASTASSQEKQKETTLTQNCPNKINPTKTEQLSVKSETSAQEKSLNISKQRVSSVRDSAVTKISTSKQIRKTQTVIKKEAAKPKQLKAKISKSKVKKETPASKQKRSSKISVKTPQRTPRISYMNNLSQMSASRVPAQSIGDDHSTLSSIVPAPVQNFLQISNQPTKANPACETLNQLLHEAQQINDLTQDIFEQAQSGFTNVTLETLFSTYEYLATELPGQIQMLKKGGVEITGVAQIDQAVKGNLNLDYLKYCEAMEDQRANRQFSVKVNVCELAVGRIVTTISKTDSEQFTFDHQIQF